MVPIQETNKQINHYVSNWTQNFTYIISLSVKVKTIKFLGKCIEKYTFHFGISKDCAKDYNICRVDIKSTKHYRKKLISCSSSKLKTSDHQKPALRKRKTKPQTRTKYTQYIYDNEFLLYKLWKELL